MLYISQLDCFWKSYYQPIESQLDGDQKYVGNDLESNIGWINDLNAHNPIKRKIEEL